MSSSFRTLLQVCVIGVVAVAPISAGAENMCPDEDGALESVMHQFQNWQDLFNSYTKYRDCDDGAIGEGWSDGVVHLLATKWDKLGELQTLLRSDPDFEAFVLKHIDATTDSHELDAAGLAAASHCPASAEALCEKIRKQVESAKAEMTQ